jgi:hypothetical protein
MRLDKPLPDSISGVKIKTDYRLFIELFCAKDEQEKAEALQKIFCNGVPENSSDEFNNFLVAGEKNKDEDGKKSFDFGKDGGRIYASFYQDYKIDLTKADLHWWQFLELFKGLSEETLIKRVMDIRTKPVDPKASTEENQRLIKLKIAFALDDYEGEISD